MADIVARAMASNATESADLANDRLDALPNGLNYKGVKDTVAELPTDAEVGDCYTVKYDEDGIETNDEYGYGDDAGTKKWIKIGADLKKVAYTGSYNDLENKLTAGSGIVISNNAITYDEEVISSVDYVDANISDTMTYVIQEDNEEAAARQAGDEALQDAIDEKQDILIAGEGISIAADGKTISATGGGGSSLEADGTTIIDNNGIISAAIGGAKTLISESYWCHDLSQLSSSSSASLKQKSWSIGSWQTNTSKSVELSLNDEYLEGETLIVDFKAKLNTDDNFRDYTINVPYKNDNGYLRIDTTSISGCILKYVWVWTGYPDSSANIYTYGASGITGATDITLGNVKISRPAQYNYQKIDSNYIDVDGTTIQIFDGKIASKKDYWNYDNVSQSYRLSDADHQSIVIGSNARAEGNMSFAVGQSSTNAQGLASVAIGTGVLATDANMLAVGKYNYGSVVDKTVFFEVGCGTSNSNRVNALAVTSDGDLLIKGNIYVGCNAYSRNGVKLDNSLYLIDESTYSASDFDSVCDAIDAGKIVKVKSGKFYYDLSMDDREHGEITFMTSTGFNNSMTGSVEITVKQIILGMFGLDHNDVTVSQGSQPGPTPGSAINLDEVWEDTPAFTMSMDSSVDLTCQNGIADYTIYDDENEPVGWYGKNSGDPDVEALGGRAFEFRGVNSGVVTVFARDNTSGQHTIEYEAIDGHTHTAAFSVNN